MVEIESIKPYEVTGKLVLDERARGKWCQLPYGMQRDSEGRILRDKYGNIKYKYPNGCPSFGRGKDCPPNCKSIESFIDLNEKHWFIVAEFDIKKQADKQRQKHPDWSELQCRNSRHWQNSVHSQLTNKILQFRYEIGIFSVYTLKPEATGIHVIKTAQKLGIPIKARFKDTVFKIGLIGYSLDRPKPLDTFMTK